MSSFPPSAWKIKSSFVSLFLLWDSIVETLNFIFISMRQRIPARGRIGLNVLSSTFLCVVPAVMCDMINVGLDQNGKIQLNRLIHKEVSMSILIL